MGNGLFKLKLSDLAKGLISAIVAAVFMSLASAFNQAGFDVFSANWGVILGAAINAGFAGFVGYVGKNWLSTDNGKFLGRIG